MRVSVIVPNYNYEKYIGRAIRSLLSQNFPIEDREIIVVDDGSTDHSLKALEPYRHRIEMITLPHRGPGDACNAGFRRATGEYVVRVDSDDYVNADFLKIESLFLTENKEYSAVSCDYLKVDTLGDRLARCSGEKEPIECGVMFRTEALFEAGLYHTNILEGKDLMPRFSGKVYNIRLPLYRYFQHDDSLTHRVKK